MEILPHRIDDGAGERAFRALFSLSAAYSAGGRRGQIGNPAIDNAQTDEGVIQFSLSGTLIDPTIQDDGSFTLAPIGLNLAPNGFDFRTLSHEDDDSGSIEFNQIQGDLAPNGFDFRRFSESHEDDGSINFNQIQGNLSANGFDFITRNETHDDNGSLTLTIQGTLTAQQ